MLLDIPSPKDEESAIGTSSDTTPLVGRARLYAYLQVEVTAAEATYPLLWSCFMTGFTSAIAYSATFIWAGFQTGGTINLGLALAGLCTGDTKLKDFKFEHPDRQALVSLLSFLLGTGLDRIAARMGGKRRSWLLLASLMQTLCLMAAALTAWQSREPSFSKPGHPTWISPLGLAALAFASASLGIQCAIGRRLPSDFGSCVLFTMTWLEFVNHPELFKFRRVSTRDHKAAALLAVFLGGMFAFILCKFTDAAVTFGIAAGFRLIGVALWGLTL